jgi:hypothetical protein
VILKLDLKIIKSKYKTVEIYKKLWLCFAWCLAACRIHGNEKREKVLLNKFLNRSLKMMQVMYVADANWDLQEKVE